MKISPRIYAKSLVETAGKDNEKVARRFWHILQKNKQYRDLPKVLDAIDEEYAKLNGLGVAQVFSSAALALDEQAEITKRLETKFGYKVFLKQTIKPNLTGLMVKLNNQIIDMTLENKTEKLKNILISKK